MRRHDTGHPIVAGILIAFAIDACPRPNAEASDAGGGPADPTFERIEVDVGARSAALVVVDVNRDDLPDLAVATYDHVVVLTNGGEGRFELSSRVDAGPNAVDLAAADLDGDGWADLVVANHETTWVTRLFGEPGGFAPRGEPRVQVDVAPHPHAVRLGDLDGDGHADLLVDDRDRESLRVFHGLGDGTFSEASLIDVGGDPYRGFVLADLDGDDRPDLATPNPDRVAVLTAGESGAFGKRAELDPGFPPFSATAGDFDGDGVMDLAAASGEGVGALALWLGRGDGSFGAPSRAEIAAGPTKSASADLTGDGRDELLVASYIGSEVAVLAGGDASSLQRIGLAGSPYGFATGDFDGDGRVDFAVANDSRDHITLFLTR